MLIQCTLQILFVFFLTLPSLLHASFNFIVFILVSVLFLLLLVLPSYMVCSFNSQLLSSVTELLIVDVRYRSSRVRAKS